MAFTSRSNASFPSPEISEVSKEDIEKVWRNLMQHLCHRHRENKRDGRSTDYRVDDLRRDQQLPLEDKSISYQSLSFFPLCISSSDYAFFEREKMGLCIFTHGIC
jgi:hypothetical protein